MSPFLEDVMDPRAGIVSPRRLGERLNMSISEIADLAGVHRNTLSRNPGSPRVQRRLQEIVRILARATDLLAGDIGRAVLWFRFEPLAGFGPRTALELVAEGHADAVMAHLDMLENGVYA